MAVATIWDPAATEASLPIPGAEGHLSLSQTQRYPCFSFPFQGFCSVTDLYSSTQQCCMKPDLLTELEIFCWKSPQLRERCPEQWRIHLNMGTLL